MDFKEEFYFCTKSGTQSFLHELKTDYFMKSQIGSFKDLILDLCKYANKSLVDLKQRSHSYLKILNLLKILKLLKISRKTIQTLK